MTSENRYETADDGSPRLITNAKRIEYALEILCLELTDGYNTTPEDRVLADAVEEGLLALDARKAEGIIIPLIQN